MIWPLIVNLVLVAMVAMLVLEEIKDGGESR